LSADEVRVGARFGQDGQSSLGYSMTCLVIKVWWRQSKYVIKVKIAVFTDVIGKIAHLKQQLSCMLTFIASVRYNLKNVVGDRAAIEAHFALYLNYIGLSCGTVTSYDQK